MAAHSRHKDLKEKLPSVQLTDRILFIVVAAEISLQRGDPLPAWVAYMDLAQETRDPRFAQRALDISLSAQLTEKTPDSARMWLKISPHSAAAQQTMQLLLILQSNWDELIPLVQAQLTHTPATKHVETLLELQQQLTRSPDKVGAANTFATLLKTYKTHPQTQLALADCYLFAEQPKLAQQVLEKILQLDAYNADANLKLAGLELQNNQPNAAKKRLLKLLTQEAHRQQPNTSQQITQRAYQLLAYAEEKNQKLEAAIAWIDKIKSEELTVMARIHRARLLIMQGKIAESRKLFAQLQNQPNLTEQQQHALENTEITVLVENKAYTQASDRLKAQLTARPKNARLWYNLAMMQEKLAQYPDMETSLLHAVEYDPEMSQAYNALGYSLANRNERLPEARSLIQKAITLNPDDPYLLDSMGWVEYRLGKLPEAKVLLQRAFTTKPEAEIGAHLGEVLWQLGELNNARGVLRQAILLDQHNETLKETLQRLLKPGEILN